MTSVATELQRVFEIEIENETIQLEDINPSLPAVEIKKLYTTQYPQLLNANIVDKGVNEDKLIFSFQTIAGRKG